MMESLETTRPVRILLLEITRMKIIFLCAALLCFASLAPADTFYLSNFGVNSITEYDDNDNSSPFTSAFVNGPNGLALDGQGNLYVSTNNNTIEKFSPSGVDRGVFANVIRPTGLAFDSAGRLYVANFGNTIEASPPTAPRSAPTLA